ncbi:MAG: ribosomal RNA small subunit methyltransferase A, partial [Verrucomicrobia bacterium]|nr:ribosomal RNA small subunit methyltransferase A [Verrucomicrobiota bacterium]
LVANLPYSVASPILVELALPGRGPRRMTVTLQREVAQRLSAAPDTDEYGVLTLLVQLDYKCRTAFRIPSGCFFPEPDVESACAVLEKRPQPLLPDPDRPVYTRLVKLSFSQRRKKMLKLLKQDWPEEALATAFSGCGIPEDVRAEKIPLEGFVRLTRHLCDWRAKTGR